MGAELKVACAKERRSGRLEAVSAVLVLAIVLVGLTWGLRAAESATHNARVTPSLQAMGRIDPKSPADVRPALHVPHTVEVDAPNACPLGMALVEGSYCPKVAHKCVRWMETEGPYARFRCAEYARPARCLAPRVSMRFCIDREEYAPSKDALPASHQSWTDAKRTCESEGKRLCRESEWVFACEGEEMRPYPYGFSRDASACNADRKDIYRADGSLRDLRDGANDHRRCVSPFGVHNLSGNLEEWTTIDGSAPARPAMKGAYWQPSRNHCRAAQTAHDRYYSGVETGFRCCGETR